MRAAVLASPPPPPQALQGLINALLWNPDVFCKACCNIWNHKKPFHFLFPCLFPCFSVAGGFWLLKWRQTRIEMPCVLWRCVCTWNTDPYGTCLYLRGEGMCGCEPLTFEEAQESLYLLQTCGLSLEYRSGIRCLCEQCNSVLQLAHFLFFPGTRL